jgi:hypothetical protein
MDTNMLLIIIVLVLLLGGGGSHDRYRLPPLRNAPGGHIGGILVGHHDPHDGGQ